MGSKSPVIKFLGGFDPHCSQAIFQLTIASSKGYCYGQVNRIIRLIKLLSRLWNIQNGISKLNYCNSSNSIKFIQTIFYGQQKNSGLAHIWTAAGPNGYLLRNWMFIFTVKVLWLNLIQLLLINNKLWHFSIANLVSIAILISKPPHSTPPPLPPPPPPAIVKSPRGSW